MSQDFQLLMLGAMYENGGNTTHRFLDGHPELFVYPFESQVGTRLVQDNMTSLFPVKYRWPAFPLDGTPAGDYHLIIDEEGKVRSRTPNVSKFRDWPFEMNDDERKARYVEIVSKTGRSRANNMAAFFRATFEAWKDHRTSGREKVYVGYSPIIVVDAAAILRDLPQAHVLHVVRNPWSAYADTCKRPVPLSLAHYLLGWTLNQYYALLYRDMFPGRLHVVRAEDVMADPVRTLGAVLAKLGLEPADSLRTPTWNGAALTQVYPWGTIRIPTPEANRATALELSAADRDEVRARAWQYLETFDYKGFV
jgi:sulfotransferase family protein